MLEKVSLGVIIQMNGSVGKIHALEEKSGI